MTTQTALFLQEKHPQNILMTHAALCWFLLTLQTHRLVNTSRTMSSLTCKLAIGFSDWRSLFLLVHKVNVAVILMLYYIKLPFFSCGRAWRVALLQTQSFLHSLSSAIASLIQWITKSQLMHEQDYYVCALRNLIF